MKFTRIPKDTFEQLQINTGMLLKNFNPNATDDQFFTDEDEITSTTGGITVNVKPTYEDFGSDIDNCPKNTKELKRITETEVSISTTALNISEDLLLFMLGAADKDITTGAIKPRKDLAQTDFKDIWWVGDKSDNGWVAVKISNALSTDGFSIKTTDKGKGNISLTLTGHVSMSAQDVIPAEFYIGSGDEDALFIRLNKASLTLDDGDSETLVPTYTDGATVSYESSDTSVATVTSGGVVNAVDEGVCVIIAKATKDGESVVTTCNVKVNAVESEG